MKIASKTSSLKKGKILNNKAKKRVIKPKNEFVPQSDRCPLSVISCGSCVRADKCFGCNF